MNISIYDSDNRTTMYLKYLICSNRFNMQAFIKEKDKIRIRNTNNKELLCSKMLLKTESKYFDEVIYEEPDCTDYSIPLDFQVNAFGIELAIHYLHYGCV